MAGGGCLSLLSIEVSKKTEVECCFSHSVVVDVATLNSGMAEDVAIVVTEVSDETPSYQWF